MSAHPCWRCQLRERLYDAADFLHWCITTPSGNRALIVAGLVMAAGVVVMP